MIFHLCTLLDYHKSGEICKFRFLHKTHYDVLELSKHCTAKEIRESFLRLSKKCHPDLHQDKNTHNDFIRLSEAYQVLSRTSSRQQYDFDLNANRFGVPPRYSRSRHQQAWHDSTIWEHRNRADDWRHRERPYYGVSGLKRVPNSSIVLFCIAVVTFTLVFEGLLIIRASRNHRENMLRRSMEISKIHSDVRAIATKFGNPMLLDKIHQEMSTTDNSKYLTNSESLLDDNPVSDMAAKKI